MINPFHTEDRGDTASNASAGARIPKQWPRGITEKSSLEII